MHVCVSCDQFVDVESSRCPKCSTRLLSLDAFRMPDLAIPRDGRSLLDMRIGTVLGGEWVVDGALGEGGDGVVYRVHNRANGQAAAAKRQRGAGEVQVDGPHVLAQIGSAAAADGRRFTLFEHCPSGSLRDVLDRLYASGQQPAVAQVIETLRQITRGLMAYHRCGVVHGDLKPDNLLVAQAGGGRGHLKLGDPLAPEDLGKSRGSPPYAAPEVCDGAQVTPKADLWALGVIGYELVTGHLPFEALGRDGVVRQVVSDQVSPPPLPRTTRRRLARLLRSLLSKDPALRPGSPEEVLGILDRVDADPEEWQRLGSIAIAAIGSLMLIAALAFGRGSAPVVAKPGPRENPNTVPVASGGSDEKAKPVQPVVEPSKASTPEKPEKREKPTAPAPEPLSVSAIFSDAKSDQASSMPHVLQQDDVVYVREGHGLRVQFPQGRIERKVKVSVDLEGSPFPGQSAGSEPPIVLIAQDKLGAAGTEKKLEWEVSVVAGGPPPVNGSVRVVVFAQEPTAFADGKELWVEAKGFTSWRLSSVDHPVDKPVDWPCQEWTMPSAVHVALGGTVLRDEVKVKWKGKFSPAIEWPSGGSKSTAIVNCVAGCKFFLAEQPEGIDPSSGREYEITPVPITDYSFKLDLRKVLRTGFQEGVEKFEIRVKSSKDSSLPPYRSQFEANPFEVFDENEYWRPEDPKYRLDQPLEIGKPTRSQVQLVCKVGLGLLPVASKVAGAKAEPGPSSGNRQPLSLKLEVPGSDWFWDEGQELLVHQGKASPKKPKGDIVLSYGAYTKQISVPTWPGYGPEPFEELVRLGGGVLDDGACVKSVERHDLMKTKLFSCLSPCVENAAGVSAMQTSEWIVGDPIPYSSDRRVAMTPIGSSDLRTLRDWLTNFDPSLAGPSNWGKLKGSSDAQLRSWLHPQAEGGAVDYVNAVDAIDSYLLCLNWAAKRLGLSVVIEAGTLTDYVRLSRGGFLRQESSQAGGALESLLLEGKGLLLPFAKKLQAECLDLNLIDFLSESTWKKSGDGIGGSSGVAVVWREKEGKWVFGKDGLKPDLHFLITFVGK